MASGEVSEKRRTVREETKGRPCAGCGRENDGTHWAFPKCCHTLCDTCFLDRGASSECPHEFRVEGEGNG